MSNQQSDRTPFVVINEFIVKSLRCSFHEHVRTSIINTFSAPSQLAFFLASLNLPTSNHNYSGEPIIRRLKFS